MWKYNEPPTAAGSDGPVYRDPSGKRVIVIGDFMNPTQGQLPWDDIGSGMGRALAQAILNHGEFDVWIDGQIAGRVQQIISGPLNDRERELRNFKAANERIRYVITGKVTDFHHTADMADELSRHGLFGPKREALVAIQFEAIDVDAGRVVVADHVFGTAKAGRKLASELYGGVSFGSYLFWSTPLGRASEAAIDEAMSQLNRLVPTEDDSIRVVRVGREGEGLLAGLQSIVTDVFTGGAGGREMHITGGPRTGLVKNVEYYILLSPEGGGAPRPIYDPALDVPIKAKVIKTGRLRSVALLMGQPPADVDLRGAVLRRELPGELSQVTGGR